MFQTKKRHTSHLFLRYKLFPAFREGSDNGPHFYKEKGSRRIRHDFSYKRKTCYLGRSLILWRTQKQQLSSGGSSTSLTKTDSWTSFKERMDASPICHVEMWFSSCLSVEVYPSVFPFSALVLSLLWGNPQFWFLHGILFNSLSQIFLKINISKHIKCIKYTIKFFFCPLQEAAM